jgi:hypothetical protein
MTAVRRLGLAGGMIVAVACGDKRITVCAGLGIVGPSIPESTSIRVGEAFLATAGADYDTCLGEPSMRPISRFSWHASDSTVVAITIIDSTHANVLGVRAGTTTITPQYLTTGRTVSPIHVVVLSP